MSKKKETVISRQDMDLNEVFSSRASAACAETGNTAPAVINTISLSGGSHRHCVRTGVFVSNAL